MKRHLKEKCASGDAHAEDKRSDALSEPLSGALSLVKREAEQKARADTVLKENEQLADAAENLPIDENADGQTHVNGNLEVDARADGNNAKKSGELPANGNPRSMPDDADEDGAENGGEANAKNGEQDEAENGEQDDAENGGEDNAENENEAKKADSDAEGAEKQNSPEFKPGDLIWSKVGKAQFWPGMVIKDPTNRRFYKESRGTLRYYVQYFGARVTHGWTGAPHRVLWYDGLQAFRKFAEEKEKKKLHGTRNFYNVDKKRSKNDQKNWEQALLEVEQAAKITPSLTRYKELRLDFRDDPKKEAKGETKRRRKTKRKTPKTPQKYKQEQSGKPTGSGADSRSALRTDSYSKSDSDSESTSRLPPAKKTKTESI